MDAGGQPYYFHRDGIGSVANLTSASGATQWTYSYEPFGPARTATQNDPAAPPNPIRFAGELRDETGFYHLRARQDDPETGRFLTRDPLAADARDPYVSSYVYANDRPTVFVDPSGMGAVWGCHSGSGADGVYIGAARSVYDLAGGINKGVRRYDDALPPAVRQMPAVGEVALKRASAAAVVGLGIYEVCENVGAGDSVGKAILRSLITNGTAVAGATVLPLACSVLLPTGPVAVGCAGAAAVGGGAGGHEFGSALSDELLGPRRR